MGLGSPRSQDASCKSGKALRCLDRAHPAAWAALRRLVHLPPFATSWCFVENLASRGRQLPEEESPGNNPEETPVRSFPAISSRPPGIRGHLLLDGSLGSRKTGLCRLLGVLYDKGSLVPEPLFLSSAA